MNNPNFAPITDEQREQAKQQRLIDQEYARNNLKINYVDSDFWKERASFYKLRMPLWWIPALETKYVRRACKKLEITVEDFVDSTGFTNLNSLVRANPTWTAFGMVGLCIEYKESREIRDEQ